MNKIYELYRMNKNFFTCSFFIYVVLIFSILTLFVDELFSSTLSSFGSPELVIELTISGNIIFFSIFIILVLLILLPSILLTIKAVKDKLNILYIIVIWICVFISCFLSFIIVYNSPDSIHKFMRLIIHFLDDKFGIFKYSYRYFM